MRILLLAVLLGLFPIAASAQNVPYSIPAPPGGFNPLNAAEYDLRVYNVPPMPIGPGTDAARQVWLAAMPNFTSGRVTATYGVGATLSAIKVSPTGIGTCTNIGSSCHPSTPTAIGGGGITIGSPKGIQIGTTGQFNAQNQGGSGASSIGDACTCTLNCNNGAGSAGVYTAPATGSLTCQNIGTQCWCAPANCGTYSNEGVVPAGDIGGTVNSSGQCTPTSSQNCTVAGGGAGQTNSSGVCVATGGGTAAPPPTGPTFTTPGFGTSNAAGKAFVAVLPVSPNLFTAAAMLIEFTLPSTMTNPDSNQDEMGIWVGTQPNGGGQIMQAGAQSSAGTNTWTPFYAFNKSGITTTISTPPLSPGDTVMVEAWNVSSTQAYVYVHDLTTNANSLTSAPASGGATWSPGQFEWAIENPLAPTDTMPNFHNISVAATSVWNTTGATGSSLPQGPQSVASQYLFESNAYSAAPTYGTFNGTSLIQNMLGNSSQCCAVATSVSGTGSITFTRSQTVN